MKIKKLLNLAISISFLIMILIFPFNGIAQKIDPYELTLEQLGQIQFGTLTEVNVNKRPLSITTITAEDIALTPARNILDLIEIYVPSALYLHHGEGEELGVRGIIADRSYKFLLLVNGKNMNIKPMHGVRTEINLWELNDIEKIEIIRGPGSVMFGPGAIGAVINITTKDALTSPGLQMGTHYWGRYDSRGGWLSYGKQGEKVDVYGYLSVVRTSGETPDIWRVQNADNFGYVGDSQLFDGQPALSIHRDLFDKPQIKAHISLDFNNKWKWWSRYTSGSNFYRFTALKSQLVSDGPWVDYIGRRQRQFTTMLEHSSRLSEKWVLSGKLGFDTFEDHHRPKVGRPEKIFSDTEYFVRAQLHYDSQKKLKTVAGFEYSYELFGPGWGEDKDKTFNIDNIISGPSSDHYAENTLCVGNGWETHHYALFSEGNYSFSPTLSALISARLDKNSYTEYMFSPRAALIRKLKNGNYLKIVAQRSVRMTTANRLYRAHVAGTKSEPEVLDAYELMYEGTHGNKTSYRAVGFYNRLKAIGWSSEGTMPLGTLQTCGLEFEADYKTDRLRIGFNHGFTKQLDWDMNPGITRSGISYSDYNQDAGGGVMLTGNGNDLSNWSNHITKFFANIKLFNDKVTLHGDTHIFWRFEGFQDGLDMIEDAGSGGAVFDVVDDHDIFETLITANAQITWQINDNASISLFVQNISILGDNKRYHYNTGYKKLYPERGWQEQPAVAGIRCRIEL